MPDKLNCKHNVNQKKDWGFLRKPLHEIAPLKAGGRLNKKDGLTRYGNSHVKDKTS